MITQNRYIRFAAAQGGGHDSGILTHDGVFDNTTGLTLEPEWSVSGGVATFDDTGAGAIEFDLDSNMTAGVGYDLTLDLDDATGQGSRFAVDVEQNSSWQNVVTWTTYSDGLQTLIQFTTPTGNPSTRLRIIGSSVAPDAFDIDNISLKRT